VAKHPSTRAIHVLRRHNVGFVPHLYEYVAKGGTSASAQALGVDEHHVVKTLILEDQVRKPLIMLMHGDRQVSTKDLARQASRKSVKPCTPATADRHSGYQVGGTSPFGTKTSMPIYMQQTIADLDAIYINGGSRGFLVQLRPDDVIRVLKPTLVDAMQAS